MKKRTSSSLRAALATLVAACLLPASAQPQTSAQDATGPESQGQAQESPEAEEPSTTAAVLDALLIRPLALLALPVGVAAFIPAALLTAPDGMDSVQSALELFVTTPANYVFRRKLGDI